MGEPNRATAALSPKAEPAWPWQLGRKRLWDAVKNTGKEFKADKLTAWAAALTYWGVLSLFPGLIALTAVIGLLDKSMTQSLLDNVLPLVPGPVKDILTSTVDNVQESRAGLAVVIGLAVAFWSASGYVSGFMQASNDIYDVPEGRPIWKTLPIRLGVTAFTGITLVVSVFIVVLSGRLAERAGKALGIASTTVAVWQVLKWPLLVLLVSLIVAVLYWAAPNAKQSGLRWVSPGGIIAVVLWIVASLGFTFYAANFASYNKTYGTLGGVIVFLIWLWLTNLAVLIGAEFNSELERQRAIAGGLTPPDKEPYVQLRDDRAIKP